MNSAHKGIVAIAAIAIIAITVCVYLANKVRALERKRPVAVSDLTITPTEDITDLKYLVKECIKETDELRWEVEQLEKVLLVSITRGIIEDILKVEAEALITEPDKDLLREHLDALKEEEEIKDAPE